MSIFLKDKKERPMTLTEGRSFLGVMIDPEIDSYFILQSKIRNSTKSEEVRKELKKIYEAGIADAIRNMVRKILISGNASSTDYYFECVKKELRSKGVHGNHVERIIDLLWRELKNQNP